MEENRKRKEAKAGISVLMSVYKNETVPHFQEAIDSILHQTRVPEEILLIEDGPLTDELEACIRTYESKYPILKVHRLETNIQLGRALRTGAKLCGYEFIARMDTDDISVPDRLEKEYDYLVKHPDTAAVGGWIEEFNDGGTLNRIKTMPETNEEIYRYGRYRSPLNHVTVMMRRKDLMECGNYRHFPSLEDYYLWMRMMAAGKKLYGMPEVFVRVRTNEEIYGRRGGIDYMFRYLKLRRIQKDLGLTHGFSYFRAVLITVGITAIPSGMRKLVYKTVLRR